MQLLGPILQDCDLIALGGTSGDSHIFVLDFALRSTDLNVLGMHYYLIIFSLRITKQNDYFGGKNNNRNQNAEKRVLLKLSLPLSNTFQRRLIL